MSHFIASLKAMPPRRTVGRLIGYGLFGGEILGSVLVSLAVVANIVAIAKTGAGM